MALDVPVVRGEAAVPIAGCEAVLSVGLRIAARLWLLAAVRGPSSMDSAAGRGFMEPCPMPGACPRGVNSGGKGTVPCENDDGEGSTGIVDAVGDTVD